MVRVLGGHRPVDEPARRVAVAQRRFAVLSVLKDDRVGAAADRSGLPNAGRLDRLDADRSRREQSPEQHPVIAEPDANRLIPVPWLEWLAPVQADVVREQDLAIVTANDSFAPGQLDQDGSHHSIVTAETYPEHPGRGEARLLWSGLLHVSALDAGAAVIVRVNRAGTWARGRSASGRGSRTPSVLAG